MSKSIKEQAAERTSAVTALAAVAAVSALIPASDLEAYKDIIAASQAESAAMTQSDLQMPFLALTQSLTKQRQRGEANYIPGLEEGDFFNTVTNEIYKMGQGVHVVPVKYEFVYNVWRPRNMGGGFLGTFTTKEEALNKAVETIMSEGGIPGVASVEDAKRVALSRDKDYGNWVKDTANQYVLVESPDGQGWAPALLSLTSSKLTPSRKWNTTIQMQLAKPQPGRAPVRWDKIWVLDTVQQKKGDNIWYNLKPPFAVGPTSLELWKQAADFYRMLNLGSIKVDYTKSGEVEEATEVTVEDDVTDVKPKF